VSRNDNGPRPYSTLRGGRIVWVYPGESLKERLEGRFRDANLKKRTRLETDSEIRSRINAEVRRRRQADPFFIWYRAPGQTSKELEADLRILGLPPRQMIEE
jgi:hypothetical protein